jgi:serine/threonine protein kinase
MEAATNNYAPSHKLDEGAFGAVYRGIIDGRAVAIKVLKLATCAPKGQTALQPFIGKDSFRREADVLGRHRHVNLVTLIGHCFADQVNADGVRHCLVFEFCAGGSLEKRLERDGSGGAVGGGRAEELQTSECSKYIVGAHVEGLKKGAVTGVIVHVQADNGSVPPHHHGPGVIAVRCGAARGPLPAEERLTIASDVARGLEYLHVDAQPPIIHQDIKSANILLADIGGRLVAKVADFGAARFVPSLLKKTGGRGRGADTHHSTVHVVGTKPYQPLEYLQLGHVSEKTDAYAFGVVLLELLTGEPPNEGHTMLAGNVLAAATREAPARRFPHASLANTAPPTCLPTRVRVSPSRVYAPLPRMTSHVPRKHLPPGRRHRGRAAAAPGPGVRVAVRQGAGAVEGREALPRVHRAEQGDGPGRARGAGRARGPPRPTCWRGRGVLPAHGAARQEEGEEGFLRPRTGLILCLFVRIYIHVYKRFICTDIIA